MAAGGHARREEGSFRLSKIAYGVIAALTVAVVVVELLHAPVLLIFALTSLTLVGLAWVLGQATESLGHHAGPRVGGILNATFGNAAELIITIFALSAGLTTVVKASIIGSIIGNVLLVLGASLLFGGLKNGTQSLSPTIAGVNASMPAIVAAALALPTIFVVTEQQRGIASCTHAPKTRRTKLDIGSNILASIGPCTGPNPADTLDTIVEPRRRRAVVAPRSGREEGWRKGRQGGEG